MVWGSDRKVLSELVPPLGAEGFDSAEFCNFKQKLECKRNLALGASIEEVLKENFTKFGPCQLSVGIVLAVNVACADICQIDRVTALQVLQSLLLFCSMY